MTVKKECGSQWRPDVCTWVTSSSPKKLPDQGEEGRSQTIGWDPKTEVAPSSRQRKKEIRKLVVGQDSWRTEPKTSTPGRRRQKNISDTKEPFLQASTKNSIKSISP